MANTNVKQAIEAPGLSMDDLLFGDIPLDTWASMGTDVAPWNLFAKAKAFKDAGNMDKAIKAVQDILEIESLESRQYLQAYNVLREFGASASGGIELIGVIVQVGMPDGLDQLAVYADLSTRYYNYSGKMIIWEHPDDSLDKQIEEIIETGKGMLNLMGPWNDKRPAAPGNGYARINFLTSHGLHFGQAAINDLFNDPNAAPIMNKMLELMKTLIDKNNNTVL
jgi:hypothetical protein